MNENKIQSLEESLAQERTARKEAELLMRQKSIDLYNKNLELEETNKTLSKVINEKEIELNNLFKTIIDPYILMDLYGNVLKMNKAAVEFYGFNNDEAPFNVMNTLYGDDVEYAMASFQEFLENGTFRNFQARVYDKEGDLKWVDINCNVIYDANNEPTLAQGILRDITKQKLHQQVFEEQKNQLNTIFENSSLGIVLSEKEKIVKANKAFLALLNYTEKELLNININELAVKEDNETTFRLKQQLNNGDINHYSANKRYKTKYGKTIWAKTNVSNVKSNSKTKKYQVTIIENITEELQNEALLKALNSLMSSILTKTGIYEIAWEITSNITKLLGFEDFVIYLLNYKTGRLKQIAAYGNKVNTDGTIKNPMEISIGDGIVGHVAKTGISEIVNNTAEDVRYITDDSKRLSEISVPIIANNEVIGVLDSEHSSMNFFTEHHLKTLETIANLAATQLKNALNLQLLVETDKKNKELLKNLTQSNKELKDFAHVVSHDLKSPLRSMDALINWIKEENDKNLNEEIEDNLNLVLKKIDKMDHLINGILKYASIEQVGKAKKVTDIQLLVSDLIETIYIPEHISITIKNILPKLKVDKFKIHQLFQNLVSNAIKYNDKEKGIVIIDCEEKKDHWQFSIEDNGIGISDKYYKKIFEIFQSLEANEDSTGIGLSIVKKIVDMYGGEVWVTSKLNKGTTFYFTLPK